MRTTTLAFMLMSVFLLAAVMMPASHEVTANSVTTSISATTLDIGNNTTTNRTITLNMQMNAVIGLVFGWGLIVLSIVDRRRPIWATFTGFVWLVLSVVIFFAFSVVFMVVGIGIGLIFMLEGTKAYAAGREGQ